MLIEIRLLARLFRIPLLRVEGVVALRDDDAQHMSTGSAAARPRMIDTMRGESQGCCRRRATRPGPCRSRSDHLRHRPIEIAVIERRPPA